MIWFSLTLLTLGIFCFDGVLFEDFNSRTSLAPDCLVVHVNSWANPKIWLLANLFAAIALASWAQTVAYGMLRERPWVGMLSLRGTIIGILYFTEIAVALPEFRVESVWGIVILSCFAIALFAAQRYRGCFRP
jgi:hypothetical protein